tara:strand:+ start:58960 stop:59436 length:477 start_codon:yes stop_codon:yes gene_type:complete
MKTNYLLPAKFKKWGLLILLPSALLGILTIAGEWEPDFLNVTVPAIFIDEFIGKDALIGITNNNILNELCAVFVIVGGLMLAFSKEKNEDEFIASIRLRSLVWATYMNYFILLLAIVLVYDFSFFWVMVFNMFTVLLLFVIKFNWRLMKFKKSDNYAE